MKIAGAALLSAAMMVGILSMTMVWTGGGKPSDVKSVAVKSRNDEPKNDEPAAKVHELGWHTSYKKATAAAKADGKLVLVDFTGSDWCGYCIKLHDEVFPTDEFEALAKDSFVLLELDFPQGKPQSDADRKQNMALARQFNIEGFPTVLFLTPEGKELSRIEGYSGKANWLKQAKDVAAANPPATQPSSKS
ncbi:MAG: thioredoxin family protein [Planctomycetota bacterium]|nr:thioredoxin family protein [Planctomycetota bacterium]